MRKSEQKLLKKTRSFWKKYEVSMGLNFILNNLVEFYADHFDESNSPNEVACAINYLAITKNPELQEMDRSFSLPWNGLLNFYKTDLNNVKSLVQKIETKMISQDFDDSYFEIPQEINTQLMDFFTDETIYNFHFYLQSKTSKKLDKSLIKEIKNIKDNFELDGTEMEYEIIAYYFDEGALRMSVYANPSSSFFIESLLDQQYNIEIKGQNCGPKTENLYIPDAHYSSFMNLYNNLNFDEVESEEDIAKIIEQYNKSVEGRLNEENKNNVQDSEAAAIRLYQESREKGIDQAKKILKTNPKNIEAKILLAGWEPDLEKRIDILEDAIKEENLSFDIKEINSLNFWWKDRITRPYMRAMLCLAQTFDQGNYIGDAIELCKELLELNPDDNQGVRYTFLDLLISNRISREMYPLIKKFPDEESYAFIFINAYITFMKHGKGHRSKNAIYRCLSANFNIVEEITNLNLDELIDRLEIDEETMAEIAEDASMEYELIDFLRSSPTFVKYMRKVAGEVGL